MKLAEEIIADEFDKIIDLCGKSGRPVNLPFIDKAIFYIVSVRCEIDGCGLSCVFEQLLNYEEVIFLISVLQKLDEFDLANLFLKAQNLLINAGFYKDQIEYVSNLADNVVEEFKKVEEEIKADERLWKIDKKLLASKSNL